MDTFSQELIGRHDEVATDPYLAHVVLIAFFDLEGDRQALFLVQGNLGVCDHRLDIAVVVIKRRELENVEFKLF